MSIHDLPETAGSMKNGEFWALRGTWFVDVRYLYENHQFELSLAPQNDDGNCIFCSSSQSSIEPRDWFRRHCACPSSQKVSGRSPRNHVHIGMIYPHISAWLGGTMIYTHTHPLCCFFLCQCTSCYKLVMLVITKQYQAGISYGPTHPPHSRGATMLSQL